MKGGGGEGGGGGEKETLHHITDFHIDAVVAAPDSGQVEKDPGLVLVVLNYVLPPFTPLLWAQAGRLRICADGGANRIYDEFPSFFPEEDPASVRLRYVPDVIKGDLDSLRPEVAKFYESHGTKIINRAEDQDTTDLHKCIDFILDAHPQMHEEKSKVLVVGALGGRLDHEFGNFNVLFLFPHLPILLLSSGTLLFLLRPNVRHVIRPDPHFEGPACGLIPLGAPANHTWTSGLRWNLEGQGMAFGGLVSTSNILEGEEVTVESDAPLIWTSQLRLPTALKS